MFSENVLHRKTFAKMFYDTLCSTARCFNLG